MGSACEVASGWVLNRPTALIRHRSKLSLQRLKRSVRGRCSNVVCRIPQRKETWAVRKGASLALGLSAAALLSAAIGD